MNREIKEKLLDFICLNYLVEKEEIDFDKSLIDEGIIDSFGLIEIASYIEHEFEIVIEESDMVKNNFGSLTNIIRFVITRTK